MYGGAFRLLPSLPGGDARTVCVPTGTPLVQTTAGSATSGKLGNNVTSGSFTFPQYVLGGYTWSQITAGYLSTCGITTAGTSFCWGSGSNGRLGNGGTTSVAVPSPISGNYTFTSIALGLDQACAISNAGVTYCWGASRACVRIDRRQLMSV